MYTVKARIFTHNIISPEHAYNTSIGSKLPETRDLGAEMTHRIQSGWKTGRVFQGFCETEE